MQYSTIQYNTVQYNTVQYNTVQCSTVQYNTVQYNTADHALKNPILDLLKDKDKHEQLSWQNVQLLF